MNFTSPDAGAEQLLEDVVDLSTRLHGAIAHFDEEGAAYRLAGPPGVAFFQRDQGDRIIHESSSPTPDLVPVLEELRKRHLERIGAPEGTDNSHLPPLLLLCLTLADRNAVDRFGLHNLARKPTEIEALSEDEGRHDPPLEPHDAALRAWVPLEAEKAPETGVHPAVLEFRFRMQRKARYAPW